MKVGFSKLEEKNPKANESGCGVAPDHHSVEQREAGAQPEQMAPDARPAHRDGRQEEGEQSSE